MGTGGIPSAAVASVNLMASVVLLLLGTGAGDIWNESTAGVVSSGGFLRPLSAVSEEPESDLHELKSAHPKTRQIKRLGRSVLIGTYQ